MGIYVNEFINGCTYKSFYFLWLVSMETVGRQGEGGKAATDSDVASIILIAFPLQVRWKSAIMQMHFCLQF